MGRSRGQEVVPEITSEKGLWQERGGRLKGTERRPLGLPV